MYKLLLICAINFSFSQNSFDKLIKKEMNKWNIPGLSICVIKNSDILLKKSYGYIDVNDSIKINNETIFPIASLTKAFTSTALVNTLLLKKKSLNTKIKFYFDNFELNETSKTQDISIKKLLSHRTGYKSYQGDFLILESDFKPKEILQRAWEIEPFYNKTDNYGYSNIGYIFSGLILEQLTEDSWSNGIDIQLLKPLKMHNTFSNYSKYLLNKNKALPHVFNNGKLNIVNNISYENINPAGGLFSNINDMTNWLLFQIGEGVFVNILIIDSKIIRLTHKKAVTINSSHDYGLGWVIEKSGVDKIISHSGSVRGFTSSIMFCKEKKLGVVVLSNSDNTPICEIISKNIMDKLLNKRYVDHSEYYYKLYEKSYLSKNKIIKNFDHSIYKYLVGNYSNEIYGKIDIKEIEGKLILSLEHHPNIKGIFSEIKNNLLVFKLDSILEEIHINIEEFNSTMQIELGFLPYVDSQKYIFKKNE